MPRTTTPTPPCCPTCGQRLPQPRTERLTPTLARALHEISRESQDGEVYVQVPAYRYQGLHARLAYWGLLEEQLHQKRDGHGQTRSGCWRPTAKGLQWLAGMIHVPAEVFVVRGKVVGLGPHLISFSQGLAGSVMGKSARQKLEDQADMDFMREQAELQRSYQEEE